MLAFKEFHQNFNTTLMVTTVALDWLKCRSDADEGFDSAFRHSVRAASPVWGGFVLKDSAPAVLQAKRRLARLGIVGVFSAFESYLEEAQEYARARGPVVPTAKPKKKERSGAVWTPDKAHWEVAKLGLSVPELEADRAVLAYFRNVRNSIAHVGGCPKPELLEIAASYEFASGFANWPVSLRAAKKGRALPPLPPIEKGRPLAMMPEHSILASAVCYRLVVAIDRKLVTKYGSGPP